jgi:hypothetical protein
MLCAIGAVVFAASATRRVVHLAALAGGFLAAAIASGPDRLPDPVSVGALSAGAALLLLFRPRYAVLPAVWGGALAGMWTAMLEVPGLPSPVAMAVVAALLALTVWLSRTRPVFAPDVLRDDALLAVTLLGLVVSIVPGVMDGWQAAANLTVEPASGPAASIPVWTLTLVGTAAALGAAYSLWSRR